MPLLDRVLAAMRVRERPTEVARCSACGRRVTDREERMRLRGGGYVHVGCATYRMRRAQREDHVSAVRSGLRPPAGTE